MGQHPDVRKLQLEAEAARNAIQQLITLGIIKLPKAADLEFDQGEGDEAGEAEAQSNSDAIQLTVESESNLMELFEKLLDEEREADADIAKMDKRIEELQARKKRYENRKASIRAVMLNAMVTAEIPSLATAFGTISTSQRAGGCEIDDESAIASDYWKPGKPTLDKKKLLADLKARAKRLKEIEKITDEDEKKSALETLDEEMPVIKGAFIGDDKTILAVRV